MAVATVSNQRSREAGLVSIPRREYEKLKVLSSLIDEKQLWFWTKAWQRKEQAADRDLKTKRLSRPYHSATELKVALKRLKRR